MGMWRGGPYKVLAKKSTVVVGGEVYIRRSDSVAVLILA